MLLKYFLKLLIHIQISHVSPVQMYMRYSSKT